MLSWLIVVIFIVIAMFVLKTNHFRHKMWIIMLILLGIFLYLSISVVQTKYDLKVSSVDDFLGATKIYIGWLSNGFGNLKTLTGDAVKMDWTNSSESLFNKNKTVDIGIKPK